MFVFWNNQDFVSLNVKQTQPRCHLNSAPHVRHFVHVQVSLSSRLHPPDWPTCANIHIHSQDRMCFTSSNSLDWQIPIFWFIVADMGKIGPCYPFYRCRFVCTYWPLSVYFMILLDKVQLCNINWLKYLIWLPNLFIPSMKTVYLQLHVWIFFISDNCQINNLLCICSEH